MAELDFLKDVVSLISRCPQIEIGTPRALNDHCTIIDVAHVVHTAKYPFKILYLKSRATEGSLDEAFRLGFDADTTEVVFAPSLDQRMRVHRQLFERAKRGLRSTNEYLKSFVVAELGKYAEALGGVDPAHYTEPPIQTPAAFVSKRPNPLVSHMLDPDDRGRLGVLLAPPGHGKTYATEHLVATLLKEKKVPIYIRSDQWVSLSPEDLRSVWKTIAHSFDYYRASISWIADHEDDFLRVAFSAGLFPIVFDGFDEYILRNRGHVDPRSVVETLTRVAVDTGARIVLTSRTSFWEQELADVTGSVGPTEGLFLYKLMPFRIEQARAYFNKRLPRERSLTAAQLYQGLANIDQDFAGRGFVLSLAADLFDGANSAPPLLQNEHNILRWLVEQLCQREQLRQGLPLNRLEQIAMLQMFAVYAEDEQVKPDSSLLSFAIDCATQERLSESDKRDCLKKLSTHPLLERVPNADAWQFRQEQVRVWLIAEEFVARLSGGREQQLRRLISSLGSKPENTELLATVAGTVVRLLLQATGDQESLRAAIRILLDAHDGGPECCAFASWIAVRAVDRLVPPGSSHADRTKQLLKLCPQERLEGLAFSGTLRAMDFRGVEFSGCRFDGVTWANCAFDAETAFRRCMFSGGEANYCAGMGSATWSPDCQFDDPARAWTTRVRIEANEKLYTSDDLEHDVRAVLRKFATRGGIGFRSILKGNIMKGTVGVSTHRDEIIRSLERHVLSEHDVSGSSEPGYHIRLDAEDDVRFLVTQNVFRGKVRQCVDELEDRLDLPLSSRVVLDR